jgi:hypothetical protein
MVTNLDQRGRGLVDGFDDDALGRRHVVRHAHEDVACRLPVEPFEGQMLDLVVKRAAQIVGHLQLEGVVADRPQRVEQLPQGHRPEREQDGRRDARDVAGRNDVVEKPARDAREDEAEQRSGHGEGEPRRHAPRIAEHEAQDEHGRGSSHV